MCEGYLNEVLSAGYCVPLGRFLGINVVKSTTVIRELEVDGQAVRPCIDGFDGNLFQNVF